MIERKIFLSCWTIWVDCHVSSNCTNNVLKVFVVHNIDGEDSVDPKHN